MAGFWSSVLANVSNAVFRPHVVYLGNSPQAVGEIWSNMSATKLWDTQPHLRTVVSFRARNVAQLGLHAYRRTDDGGRERDRDSKLATLLRHVNDTMTPYDLLFSLVGDHDLYDTAFWLLAEGSDGWEILRLPPASVEVKKDGTYRVTMPDGKVVNPPAENVVHFRGYTPASNRGCSSTVEALKETLHEQVEASKFRKQLWQRGGRVSSVLERPLDAPEWSAEAREAFRTDWYEKYTGNGSYAGGTPILEDGMRLNRIDFSAKDQEWVEAARLSLETVAAAYHVPAAMVGMGSEATFSNMRAFRKMLYTETLGPLLAMIEARINKDVIRVLGLDPAEYYVEFNIAEKLQGDFEEQAAVLASSTGRPWMTANEARARQNLPALPGGDELVVPLNVLVGGQASPRDSGTQNEVPDPVQDDTPKGRQLLVKAAPTEDDVDRHTSALVAFFERQGKAVGSRAGAGADWWDADRWDDELSDVLLGLAAVTSVEAARAALKDAGLDPDLYDVDRTMAFLREASRRSAVSVNESTKRQLDAVADEDGGVGQVFELSKTQRAVALGVGLATFAAGFGSMESAKQSGAATKTWITGPNARPSHAAMDGETVPLSEDFSNGMPWPGGAGADEDDIGCNCSLRINY